MTDDVLGLTGSSIIFVNGKKIDRDNDDKDRKRIKIVEEGQPINEYYDKDDEDNKIAIGSIIDQNGNKNDSDEGILKKNEEQRNDTMIILPTTLENSKPELSLIPAITNLETTTVVVSTPTLPTITKVTTGQNEDTDIWNVPLRAAYEDEYLVAVVKPQGMPVMGATRTLSKSDLLMRFVPNSPHHKSGSISRSKDKKNKKIKRAEKALVEAKIRLSSQSEDLSAPNTTIATTTTTTIATTTIATTTTNNNNNNNKSTTKKNSEDLIFTKPRIVHRLDSATGGILLVAKTRMSESLLKRAFADRKVSKRYRAIVLGRLEGTKNGFNNGQDNDSGIGNIASTASNRWGGIIDSPISSKRAITGYEIVHHTRCVDPIIANGWMTTVDLYPVTGRRHQLRRHMKEIGFWIMGDRRYGPPPPRQVNDSDGCNTNNGSHRSDRYVKSDNVNGNDGIYCEKDDVVEQRQIQQQKELKGPLQDNNDAANNGNTDKLCLWAVELTFPHPFLVNSNCINNGNEPNDEKKTKEGQQRNPRCIKVEIDEPDFYEEIRIDQERIWREESQECSNGGSERNCTSRCDN